MKRPQNTFCSVWNCQQVVNRLKTHRNIFLEHNTRNINVGYFYRNYLAIRSVVVLFTTFKLQVQVLREPIFCARVSLSDLLDPVFRDVLIDRVYTPVWRNVSLKSVSLLPNLLQVTAYYFQWPTIFANCWFTFTPRRFFYPSDCDILQPRTIHQIYGSGLSITWSHNRLLISSHYFSNFNRRSQRRYPGPNYDFTPW